MTQDATTSSGTTAAVEPPAVDDEPAVEDGPLVTVAITTYFRNARLRAAIESALAQRYPEVEIVVVDDSGTRHAADVVAGYPDVEYIGFDRNRGANTARTVALRETDGRYVQYLDDDDRLRADKLDRQVALLEAGDAGVAYCGMQFEDGPTITPDPGNRGDVLEAALAFELYPCQTTTMLTAREHLEAVAPFRNRVGADDFGRMIELARRTEFDFEDAPLVIRGNEGGSRGHSLGVYHGRMNFLSEYADLYDEFPPDVRHRALGDTYRFYGDYLLDRYPWSPTAVRAYARACYHTPNPDAKLWGRLAAAPFGRPGVTAAARIHDRLLD